MKETSEITACVVDHGIFLPIARRLAREYRKVYYFTPYEKSFPTVRDVIGDGFEDIERVDSPWSVKGECDLFVFPDIGFSGMQLELISQGMPVWGPRDADSLEIQRGSFLRALMDTTLPVPPYRTCKGIEELQEVIRSEKDKFIKISRFRGDWETFHWRSWEQDKLELAARAVKLGPWADAITFYVFDKIETSIEDGCDAYCIGGRFPKLIIHGMEAKDRAYLGTFQPFDDLPEEMWCVNDAFGAILARYDYRAFFSTEVRITEDKKSYFIDPTLRAGSPPSQVMCEMIANLGEIVWHGANGKLLDPWPAAKFGVQGIITAKADPRGWRVVQLPDELEQWAKFGMCSKLNGCYCFPPETDGSDTSIGWLVGIGDTIEEAMTHFKKNVEHLPDGLSSEIAGLAELLEEVHEAEAKGMEFTDQKVPDPASVMVEKSS